MIYSFMKSFFRLQFLSHEEVEDSFLMNKLYRYLLTKQIKNNYRKIKIQNSKH